jgi:hypothetical protein
MKPNPYRRAADVLVRESGVTVRKVRSSNTGRAAIDDDAWAIDAPEPRGPVSFGVFAHEVAHHLLHRWPPKRPRWVEEVEAEEWALAQFDRFELRGRDRYEAHAAKHLAYTFAKATRRSPRLFSTIIETYPGWWDRVEQIAARAMFDPSMSRERRALDRD